MITTLSCWKKREVHVKGRKSSRLISRKRSATAYGANERTGEAVLERVLEGEGRDGHMERAERATRTTELFHNGLLYASFVFTCIEDRGFSFAISLVMQLLGGMQLVSIEQLAEGVAQMITSGPVGKVVDQRSERIYGMAICLAGNNFSILATCILFSICLSVSPQSVVYTLSLIAGIFFCGLYRVFVSAEKIIVSRDWAIVLATDAGIARTNALTTGLDQLTNVISPLIIGGMLAIVSLRTACISLGVASIISLALKSLLLWSLYSRVKRLHIKVAKNLEENEEGGEKSAANKGKDGLNVLHLLSIYYSQRVFPAAIGMALLFMTVMGFDGLAVGYGASAGVPESVLGVFRSFGSVAGVTGAFLYALFAKYFGVRRTGAIGLVLQELCLLIAVASIWLPGTPFAPGEYFGKWSFSSWWSAFLGSFSPSPSSSPSVTSPEAVDWANFTSSDGQSLASIFAFLIGIATARLGLWMADLAIWHLMQLHTEEADRNTVFGVHNAICQSFSVLKDLLVIALPDPSTFGLCILISFAFVCSGSVFYLYYLFKTRRERLPESGKRSH